MKLLVHVSLPLNQLDQSKEIKQLTLTNSKVKKTSLQHI